MALMFWFGGWLLSESQKYTFRDFIISMMALFFSIYGLTVAFEGATDRTKAKLAAERIFTLSDRKSSIDPLHEGGQCPDDAFLSKARHKKSSKKGPKHKKHSSKVQSEHHEEIPSRGKHKKKMIHKDHAQDDELAAEKKPSSVKKNKRKSSTKIVEEPQEENAKPSSSAMLTKHKKKKGSFSRKPLHKKSHGEEIGQGEK
jgi:hypothetical protein